MYIVAATCIGIFKKEKCNQSEANNQTNVMQTYKLLWKIINLQTIKDFAVVMLAYEVMILLYFIVQLKYYGITLF